MELKEFLDGCKSMYHTVSCVSAMLEEAGYTRIRETQDWNLEPGGKYYVTRGDSSIIAFRIPEGEAKGYMMSASHTDRPTFKVKEFPELKGVYTRLATEVYGGALLAPWFDRPLSVAGRVMVETDRGIEPRLVDIDRDIMLIPSVAIHMNREQNKGWNINPAVDTVPLMGSEAAAGKLWPALEEQAGGKILGHDLYLYLRQKAMVWGLEEEYISAAGLDDLMCVWGCTRGLVDAKASGCVSVLCVLDTEEVGSSSVQGAASTFLADILERVSGCLGADHKRMLSNSFMVSADNGHAIHPNHPEYADPNNAPRINGGVVVKFNASWRYSTDGISAALFRRVCKKAGVPTQNYCNRADVPGGATLGHISLHQVSIPTVDLGLAQLAMHSCYETAGVKDGGYLARAMAEYYSCTLTVTDDGAYQI